MEGELPDVVRVLPHLEGELPDVVKSRYIYMYTSGTK